MIIWLFMDLIIKAYLWKSKLKYRNRLPPLCKKPDHQEKRSILHYGVINSLLFSQYSCIILCVPFVCTIV